MFINSDDFVSLAAGCDLSYENTNCNAVTMLKRSFININKKNNKQTTASGDNLTPIQRCINDVSKNTGIKAEKLTTFVNEYRNVTGVAVPDSKEIEQYVQLFNKYGIDYAPIMELSIQTGICFLDICSFIKRNLISTTRLDDFKNNVDIPIKNVLDDTDPARLHRTLRSNDNVVNIIIYFQYSRKEALEFYHKSGNSIYGLLDDIESPNTSAKGWKIKQTKQKLYCIALLRPDIFSSVDDWNEIKDYCLKKASAEI